MWISTDTATRAGRPSRTVEFLEAPPVKPYTVIGIITPPAGFYETEAEAVADMRIYAGEHRADAMFIESRTETSGWAFSYNGWGGSGGSTGGMHIAQRRSSGSRRQTVAQRRTLASMRPEEVGELFRAVDLFERSADVTIEKAPWRVGVRPGRRS
jgi:hypothetical protein